MIVIEHSTRESNFKKGAGIERFNWQLVGILSKGDRLKSSV